MAEYRVVTGDAARDLLRKPGVVFTCRGYQFRTGGNDQLECWGQGLTGELDWQPYDAVGEIAKMFEIPWTVLKEPVIYTEDKREAMYTSLMVVLGVPFLMRRLQEECAELIAAVNCLDRESCSVQHVINKVADVQVMLDQARRILGQELVDRAVQVRLNRVVDYVAGVEGSEF